MFKFIFSMLFSVVIFAPSAANAAIDVTLGPVQRYFLSDERPYQTLTVSNNNETDSLELKARFLLYTNLTDPNRENPISEEVEGHFLLAPKKFVLTPRTHRSIRMVRTLPLDDKERVYALSYRPTLVKEEEVESNKDSIKLGMSQVSTGGIIVYVSPKEIDFNVTYKRDEEGVYFVNEGNITSELRPHSRYCYEINEEEKCMTLPPVRLSPGEKYFFKIDAEIPLVWTVKAYGKYQKKAIIEPFDE